MSSTTIITNFDEISGFCVCAILLISKMADSEAITVGNYFLLTEAELVQGLLEDGGIKSVIIDDNVGRMLGWNVVGGFKLQVNKSDAEVALQLLSAAEARSREKSAGQQTRCPNCDSSEVTVQENERPVGYSGNSLLTPAVVHMRDKSWACKSCGYCWDSSEEDSESIT